MFKLMERFRKMRNRKGFTLIELIVVIVIIGILAAIIIPRLSGFTDAAQDKANLASARTVYAAAAVAQAADEAEAVIESEAALVTAGYLASESVSEAAITITLSGSAIEVKYSTKAGDAYYPPR